MQSAILEKTDDRFVARKKEVYRGYPRRAEIKYAATDTIQSNCIEHVKKRSAPDVVVIGDHGHILFISHRHTSVLELLEDSGGNPEEYEARQRLMQTLERLSVTVFSQTEIPQALSDKEAPSAYFSFGEASVSLRAQRLKGVAGTPDFAMVLIEPLQHKTHNPARNLSALDFTPREQTVLPYVKKGFTNKEIAYALDISVYTVKDHVKRIMKKLGVHTRTGIAGKLEILFAAAGEPRRISRKLVKLL